MKKVQPKAVVSFEPMAPWLTAFKARDDLTLYQSNSIGLFALALKFNLEDIAAVAADSITDGNDDKKCDLLYINKEEGVAVIAQCYLSLKVRDQAPANKASDLNTAVNWLLQREINELPDSIRSHAQELRQGISDASIKQISVWYVHNMPASANAQNELKTVEATLSAALRMNYTGKSVVASALEVGSEQISEWYNDTQSPILVNNQFSIVVDSGFEVKGPAWKSFVTTISLRFLRNEFNKHKTKLFSANVRDYLGSMSAAGNINNGIKKTAQDEPANFWAYNNGLTILVN